jgi:hypothetical protein
VLLSGCWANTAQSGDPDEAVEIWNGGAIVEDVSGWTISDDEGGSVTLPPGSSILPDERLWITRDALAFELAFGRQAALESLGTDPSVPDVSGTWPQLANTGDEVRLADASGSVVDLLVYGDAVPSMGGWTGPGATPGWDTAFGSSQLVITRDRMEGGTACLADTDSAGDWDDLRLVRPGTTYLLPVTYLAPGRVTAAIGPDATLDLLETVVRDARTSLRLAIYYVSNPAVVDLLVDAIERGVDVRVLLEGEPVGGRSDGEKWGGATLADAGADVRWLANDTGEIKRYPYHHAKYAVADDAVTYVATENAGTSGHPIDTTAGNRGWALRVDDARLAGWHAALFEEDRDLRHADVRLHDPFLDAPPTGFVPPAPPAGWHYPVRATHPADDAASVTPVVSPDHASLETAGVLGLFASAGTSLDVQHLSMPLHWGRSADPPDDHPSAVVQGLLAAARRGVDVRVILDGFWWSVDPTDPRDNDDTCALFNSTAAAESLALACRVLDPTWLGLSGIHVKGILADGRIAHVGSMNGTSNSYRLNREAAIQVESPSTVAYFAAEYERDWYVAGVGAQVPAEVQGLRVSKSPAGLALRWDDPPAGAPTVTGYRTYRGPDGRDESRWIVTGEGAPTSVEFATTSMPLECLLVVAYAAGPGGTVEGPSGAFDAYLDR